MNKIFEFKSLPDKFNYLAPDTSEIRLLLSLSSGGLCHCLLPMGGISTPIKHKTVDEIWYCLSGKGVIWQKNTNGETELEFMSGDSFIIPCGNYFQFKNNDKEPLRVIISTMPQWPGPDEAIQVEGKWQPA